MCLTHCRDFPPRFSGWLYVGDLKVLLPVQPFPVEFRVVIPGILSKYGGSFVTSSHNTEDMTPPPHLAKKDFKNKKLNRSFPVFFIGVLCIFVSPKFSLRAQTAMEDCLIPNMYDDAVNGQIFDNQCWQDSINISGVDLNLAWQDLDPIDQVLGILLEHSYMSDLTITFICPNGQSILVHQGGGGNTALGVPVDNWDDLDIAGIGWEYYWDPGAINGTWEDNGWEDYGGGTLPSGSYESVQSFTNLNGCPINGTWEVEVCDTYALDNGFVFDWSVPFSQSICITNIQIGSESAYSYCSSDGSIAYQVDSLPGEEINVHLSTSGTTLETGPLQAQQTYAGLPGAIYDLSFHNSEGEFQSYSITVENAIFPSFNAGADPICSASLDAVAGLNRVTWEKDDVSYIASFDIYRESNVTSQFEWVGNVHVDSLSSYLDVGFDPGASSTQYNLVANDSCGGEIDLAAPHRTIHLQSNLGINGEVNLFWNPYEGINYDNFSIHRSTNGTEYFPIGTVANNVYAFTDQFPPSGNKWYQVQIPLEDVCIPIRTQFSAYIGSNINALSISEITENQNNKYTLIQQPEYWWLNWSEVGGGSMHVLDMTGRIVSAELLLGNEGNLRLNLTQKGAFVIHVTDARGKTSFVERIIH
jgi:subtilisin-like proprotein convertase family protein